MNSKYGGMFKPIALVDGAFISSLAESRQFISTLPEAFRDAREWKYAADLLARAADLNEKYSTMDARAQLTRALKLGGFTGEEPPSAIPRRRGRPSG